MAKKKSKKNLSDLAKDVSKKRKSSKSKKVKSDSEVIDSVSRGTAPAKGSGKISKKELDSLAKKPDQLSNIRERIFPGEAGDYFGEGKLKGPGGHAAPSGFSSMMTPAEKIEYIIGEKEAGKLGNDWTRAAGGWSRTAAGRPPIATPYPSGASQWPRPPANPTNRIFASPIEPRGSDLVNYARMMSQSPKDFARPVPQALGGRESIIDNLIARDAQRLEGPGFAKAFGRGWTSPGLGEAAKSYTQFTPEEVRAARGGLWASTAAGIPDTGPDPIKSGPRAIGPGPERLQIPQKTGYVPPSWARGWSDIPIEPPAPGSSAASGTFTGSRPYSVGGGPYPAVIEEDQLRSAAEKSSKSAAAAVPDDANKGRLAKIWQSGKAGKGGLIAGGLVGAGTLLAGANELFSGDEAPEEQPFQLQPPGGQVAAGGFASEPSALEAYYASILEGGEDDDTDMYSTLKEDLDANIAQQKAAATSLYNEQQGYLGDLSEQQRIANKNWEIEQANMQQDLDTQRRAQMGDVSNPMFNPRSESGQELASDMATMSQQERQRAEADRDYGRSLLDSDFINVLQQAGAAQHPRMMAEIDRSGADSLADLQMQQLEQERESRSEMVNRARDYMEKKEMARYEAELEAGGQGMEGVFVEPAKRPQALQRIIGHETAGVMPSPQLMAQAGLDDPSSPEAIALQEQIIDAFMQTGDARYLTEYLAVREI